MRNFALRNYMEMLMASNGMWEVATAYCRGLVDCDVAMDREKSHRNAAPSRNQQRR